jgi:adenylate cyclase
MAGSDRLMRDPPLILIVDDNADNREILEARLTSQGYRTAVAMDGEEALQAVPALLPDLVLLDVMMPKADGFEVTRQLRADSTLPYIPIILVTAKAGLQDIVHGLDVGADEYLTKPVEHAALVARVRANLRAKALHDEVQAQKAELAAWNRTLAQRVAEQVAEIERVSRLRRFLPPQVADAVVSDGAEALLASRRLDVTVLFSDLRGFTAFAESAPPEDVMDVLAAYHRLAGPLIHAHGGTLERFLGDGIMVIFNAPLPCPDPSQRAVRLARSLRDGFAPAVARWQRPEAPLGLGIGIAHGPATVGQIGFEGRLDYAAIGSVANLAARLCSEAEDGEILVSERVAWAIDGLAATAEIGALPLKGFAAPVSIHQVVGSAITSGSG